MLKRIVLCCACLVVAYPAMADPIVTWQGSGFISSNSAGFNSFPVPPVGTALSWTVSFDPSQQVPTFNGLSTPTPGCMTVPVSGAVTIGAYTYTTGSPSLGFTQAMLPGTTCSNGGLDTQFSMHSLIQPAGNPWPFQSSVLIISYRDLLMHDGFPTVPTASGAFVSLSPTDGFGGVSFNAPTSISAVDVGQTPVPEPGTMTLLGLGLAAAFRKARGRRLHT